MRDNSTKRPKMKGSNQTTPRLKQISKPPHYIILVNGKEKIRCADKVRAHKILFDKYLGEKDARVLETR